MEIDLTLEAKSRLLLTERAGFTRDVGGADDSTMTTKGTHGDMAPLEESA